MEKGQEAGTIKPLQDTQLTDGSQKAELLTSQAGSEVIVAKTVAKELKIPFVDPLHARIDPAAVSLLKSDMAFRLQAVPIRIVYDNLLVAMANPRDAAGIKALELSTWCKIRPAAAPKGSVSAALQVIYRRAEGPSVKKDPGTLTPPRVEASLAIKPRAYTVSIISNKGGVGKTHFSINISLALAKMGAKVLLIDTDLGNADISNKLGISPKYHLLGFLEKKQQMSNIIVHTKYKVDLICGKSGESTLANLNYAQKIRFIKHFKRISQDYDFAIFDLGAGISRIVLDFALAADRTVILTTPQDLVSGYACARASFFRFREIEERLKKRLPKYRYQWTFAPMIVINQAGSLAEGIRLYKKMDEAVNMNINLREGRFSIAPEYLGAIPYDRGSLRRAEIRKRPLMIDSPYIKASQCIQHMSKKFFDPDKPYDPMPEIRYPFRRFAAILARKV